MIATTAQAMTNTTTRARWTAAAYILGALLCGLSTAVARLAGRPGGIAENLDRVESIAAAIVAGPLFGLLIGGTVKLFYRPTSLARWMFWASVVVMVSQGMGR